MKRPVVLRMIEISLGKWLLNLQQEHGDLKLKLDVQSHAVHIGMTTGQALCTAILEDLLPVLCAQVSRKFHTHSACYLSEM